jgi:hypothetical protein
MKLKREGDKLYEMTRFMYRCDLCNDIIESKTQGIVRCNCGNLSISGGIEYGGLVSCIHDLYTDVSEWKLIQ